MTGRMKFAYLLALAFCLAACSKGSQPAVPPPAPASPAPVAESSAPPPQPVASRGVKTEMRNVNFHLTLDGVARLETLSGELWPTGKNEMPVFDDKTSFEVRVSSGKVSITPAALSAILNTHVFAGKDAPLKEITVAIDKNRLIIKGKLHSKGDIPFETAGTVSTTEDGRIRVHTEKVKALHLPVKGVMGMFGLELANIINTSKIEGLDTDKDDMLLDLGKLLPPPHIRGKVTGVALENNTMVTYFGNSEKSAAASSGEKVSYMSFQGNPVRFGTLLMEKADLTVLDMDPGDPLDWNQDRYRDQLVAGYSKITPSFGLRAYVKDFAKLGRNAAAQSNAVPKQ